MNLSIKRIYHPFWLWEEIDFNMWGSVKDRAAYLEKAIVFTGDHIKYGSYMAKVVEQWRCSCEHNLSNITQNRKAWIGHAACALAMKCPEDIVRQAWGHLTEEQQNLANAEAQKAIELWEREHAEDRVREERILGSARADFMDFRHVQQSLPFILCGQGQYCHAPHGCG